ncbi:MAG: hypothetical protein LBJ97_01025 [Mycoplasmataceae bacterium]|nr:hypothetical protein [Mycoplasmataceae bacterium]
MNSLFNGLGYGNYALFAIFAFIIVFASYLISHIVDATEKRTKFSGVLIAGTVVAFVSSMPEFTSSLVGIFTTNNPAVASGNLLGGNLFRTAMLGLTLIFYIMAISRAKTTIVQVSLTVSQIVIFAIYFLVMWLVRNQFTENIMTIIFSCISGGVLLVYIFNLFIMIKKGKKDEEIVEAEFANDKPKQKGIQIYFRKYFAKIKLWKMGLIFVIAALVIVLTSMCIAISTNWILAYSWGWDADSPKTGFGYSLLLGIVTSIPELITVITLLKLQNVNAAIGDILGSNMFSCLILSIVDLVYWHGNDTLFGKGSQEALIISFWCFVSMVFVGGVLLINYLFRNSKHGRLYYSLSGIMLGLIFLTYVAYLILSALGIYMFKPINPDPGPTLNTSINDLYNTFDILKIRLQ